jgi:hypothetical protein
VTSIILTDNFTDTDGVLITAHTSDTLQGYVRQAGVTAPANDAEIFNNRVFGRSPNGVYRANFTMPSPDYEVEAVVNVLSNTGILGITARASSANREYYVWRYRDGGGGFTLRKWVNGTETVLFTFAQVLIAGQTVTLKIVCRGNVIEGFVNGVKRASVVDSDIVLAGSVGLSPNWGVTTTTGLHIDSIVARIVVSTPTISNLTPSYKSIKAEWTIPNEVSVISYIIEYKKASDATWTVADTIPAPLKTYTITGLDHSTQYHVRVKGINDTDVGNYSDVAITQTLTIEQITSIASLFPRGRAWDSVMTIGTNLNNLCFALAETIKDFKNDVYKMYKEIYFSTHTSLTHDLRLAEYGLPNSCDPLAQTLGIIENGLDTTKTRVEIIEQALSYLGIDATVTDEIVNDIPKTLSVVIDSGSEIFGNCLQPIGGEECNIYTGDASCANIMYAGSSPYQFMPNLDCIFKQVVPLGWNIGFYLDTKDAPLFIGT